MMSPVKALNWLRKHVGISFAVCLCVTFVAWLYISASREIDPRHLASELESAALGEELSVVDKTGRLAPSLSTLQERLKFVETLRAAGLVNSGERIPTGVLAGSVKLKTPRWQLDVEIYPSTSAATVYLIFDGSGDLNGRLRTTLPEGVYAQIVQK